VTNETLRAEAKSLFGFKRAGDEEMLLAGSLAIAKTFSSSVFGKGRS
jgi:hypothetical protein